MCLIVLIGDEIQDRNMKTHSFYDQVDLAHCLHMEKWHTHASNQTIFSHYTLTFQHGPQSLFSLSSPTVVPALAVHKDCNSFHSFTMNKS